MLESKEVPTKQIHHNDVRATEEPTERASNRQNWNNFLFLISDDNSHCFQRERNINVREKH